MFPYYKNFVEKSIEEIFDNLEDIPISISHSYYRMYSCYPKHKLFNSGLFRNQYLSLGVGDDVNYEDGDVLTDLYLEELRISARRNDDISLKDQWKNKIWRDKVISSVSKNGKTKSQVLSEIRKEIKYNFAEVQNFSVVKGMAILKNVLGETQNKKWLDISAGWGDRLIIAMKLGMIYHACDPNKKLKPFQDKMIEQLAENPENYVIDYIPFQEKVLTEKYDVVFSSPPYFDLEIYDDNCENQSVVTYPDFKRWLSEFLFLSLDKCWNALDYGGYLILHLGDTKKINMCEVTNLFIQDKLEGSSYHGVIGLKGQSGFSRPVWVWQKLFVRKSAICDYKLLQKDNSFTLKDIYPDIDKLL